MTTTSGVTGATATSSIQSYINAQASTVAADSATASKASSSTALASATSVTMIGSNFNTFIKILTTQLQHQDPTNTTDPNQFTQELVQFAGVEQQLNTNNDLQTLINLQKASSGVTAALSYMGQYVEVKAPDDGSFSLQSGAAELGYNLTAAAKSATVTVKDSSGKTVATLTGSTDAGMNYVTWDGKDSSGKQLPDGAYTFTLAALNKDGSAQTVSDTRVIGKVTGVTSNEDGTTSLSLGVGVSALTADVDAVFSTGTLPSAT